MIKFSLYHKDSVVKQSGNDVEGCRSQKVLFQPNMLVFLQYSVTVEFELFRSLELNINRRLRETSVFFVTYVEIILMR